MKKFTETQLIAEARQLLANARYQDGQAIVLTQDCEALEAAITQAEDALRTALPIVESAYLDDVERNRSLAASVCFDALEKIKRVLGE